MKFTWPKRHHTGGIVINDRAAMALGIDPVDVPAIISAGRELIDETELAIMPGNLAPEGSPIPMIEGTVTFHDATAVEQELVSTIEKSRDPEMASVDRPPEPGPGPEPQPDIVTRSADVALTNLVSLRSVEDFLVHQIAADTEELRLTRIAIAANEALRARLGELGEMTSFELNEIQFLMRLDVEVSACIGRDTDDLAYAKSLLDRGLVTITNGADGPMVDITPAGVYARSVRPIGRLASAKDPNGKMTTQEVEAVNERARNIVKRSAQIKARTPTEKATSKATEIRAPKGQVVEG